MKYNIIIPVAFRDYEFLKTTVIYIEKYLCPNHIYIITNIDMSCCIPSYIKKNKLCIILDEDNMCPYLKYEKIEELLIKHQSVHINTGWFFQQFLKLGFSKSKYCNNKYYLSWDADTLPINHIEFFDEKNKPYFSMKSEYHKPYFDTIEKLFGTKKKNKKSYIAEHMMFNKNIVSELIDSIDSNNSLSGDYWFEKIINTTDPNERCSFSEFETYGNYCYKKYPYFYIERNLPSFRCGGLITGRFINERIMKELSIDLFTISFELYNKPPFPWSIASWFYEKYIKNYKYKEYKLRKRLNLIV